MLRRFGAAVAVLACLSGFFAAPYTHAHHAIASVIDDQQTAAPPLVHTHASPHSHHDADHPERGPAGHDSQDQIWSVDNFVFQQAASTHDPGVDLVITGTSHIQLRSIWLRADRLPPRAHGPPVGPPSGLRAPPVFLPALA
jgi:hypothetical protein